jgi:hypothetical protein
MAASFRCATTGIECYMAVMCEREDSDEIETHRGSNGGGASHFTATISAVVHSVA